jgi:hypothetical protein
VVAAWAIGIKANRPAARSSGFKVILSMETPEVAGIYELLKRKRRYRG